MSTMGNRSFRPRFHFAPQAGWINDPNGLLYENGTWHLFAQHYPDKTIWGPMHWLHATGDDLLSWQELPIALKPDPVTGMCFSGSAVIDRGNTSGLGEGVDPMILMYTGHGEHEQQCIAFSQDRVHFTPYEHNPVIPNVDKRDFRDPKVFRNDILNCWTVVIAAGDHVEFHASDDLIHWRKTGEFGQTENKLGGVFECPDLFPLTVPDGKTVWVLIGSMALPREFGGSRTQYFLGQFNGSTFTEADAKAPVMLLDTGYDNYAAVTFSDAPETTLMGWGTSWNYAPDEPTSEFCGVMTYARHLSLVETPEGLRLANHPITPAVSDVTDVTVIPPQLPFHFGSPSQTAPLPGEYFRAHVEADGAFTLSLENEAGEALRVSCDNEHRFVVDRTAAGQNDFSAMYKSGLMSVTVTPRLFSGHLSLDLYFDRMIAEIFADDGVFTNTALVFPKAPYTRAVLKGKGDLTIGELKK